mgnify:CR=1 FL=1
MQSSFLFVPGDRPERFEKAAASGAHAIVIDLEDAVQPDRKGLAREAVRSWLSEGRPAVVRINGDGTEWHEDDLALLSLPSLQAVMVPKCERPDSLARIERAGGKAVIALVESAFGVWHALDIATAPNVIRLAFGSVDFGLDAGIDEDGEGMAYARSRLVLASAVAGLAAPIDGVTLALDDADRLRADVLAAKRLGLGGKLCIHPRQVEAVNAGFAPTEAQLAWARDVVEASNAAPGNGALRVKGQMIDRPVIERARRLLGSGN